MSATSTMTSELTLSLTEEERRDLLSFLEQGLRETLVEVHRTDSLDYRHIVERKEAVLRRLIDKLRQP
jgi:hypothetical protein